VYSDRLPFRGRSRRARLSALPSAERASGHGRDRDREVAAHALRHLAFLVAEDPREYEAKLSVRTRRSLRRLCPAAAGKVRHKANRLGERLHARLCMQVERTLKVSTVISHGPRTSYS
jgi:hypothetical protein